MPKMFTATFLFLNIVCVSCLKVSPPLREERPIDLATIQSLSSEMQEMMAPMGPDNYKYLEATGLRPELEQMLKKISRNMSFIFIGDSVVRNQYQSLCHLMKAPEQGDGVFGQHQHCQKNGITAIASFIQQPAPDRLSQLLAKKGVNVPDVIYWDSAQLWANVDPKKKRLFLNPYYSEAVEKTLQNMRTLAPNAKNCFFMTHATCDKQKKIGSVTREEISQLNEIAVNTQKAQGGKISVVDGYALTKDQCSISDDGRHWNKLAWHELKMLLETVL